MDKSTFLSVFCFDDKDILSGLYDKSVIANRTGKTFFSNYFLPPSVWKPLMDMENKLGLCIGSFGVFQEADRRIISFSKEIAENYPLKLLKITCSSKFFNVTHADYLGAVMSLGIKREKLGDLIVSDENCYMPVCEDICRYILDNLYNIGKCPCKTDVIDWNSREVPQYNFESKVILCASNRLDCIVGSLCSLSRSRASELIKQGKIFLDYEIVTKLNKEVKCNSIITVRGFGKFKVQEELGWSGRGKTRILVKKYI